MLADLCVGHSSVEILRGRFHVTCALLLRYLITFANTVSAHTVSMLPKVLLLDLDLLVRPQAAAVHPAGRLEDSK